uniref:Uncharacterized protein n=1 Tax=Dunaliella tertiolecta TaxID=3047 RepID=A0A7S3VKC7_DUNTE|mmetsp:Transcript_25314/g.65256  ORF Transcript_25314/g.65256 Transcript_25314/m.65256 type:complete len:348 (+) Transcript_25314:45-1088(+)
MVNEDHDLKAALELHAAINGLRRGRREPSHGHEKALEMVRQKRAKTAEAQENASKNSAGAAPSTAASAKPEQQHQQKQAGSKASTMPQHTPPETESSHSGHKRRDAGAEEEVPSKAGSSEKRDAKRVKTETHDSGSKGSIAGNQAGASVKSEHQQQQQQQQQPKKERRPTEGRKQRQKVEGGPNNEAHEKSAPSTSVGKDAQEARPQTVDVSQQPEQQAASAQPPTALEDAAHAAGAATQLRVKQQGAHSEDDAARRIKCFMAGIRWGINLTPDSLTSRSDLATALNDALAGEILSCGRGDMLNITMLDREGNASEFPPLKSGTRECSSQWKSSVTISTRIYVRHGH